MVATGLIASTYGLVRLAYGLFLPDVQESLAMGDAVAGRISSGASVAYCVGALCGLAAPRHARALVVAALATASIGSIGMAVAGAVPLFAASAVLASSGAGLASPALVVVVERNVTEVRRDRAQAAVNAGTGPGLVAAGALALVLLPHWRVGLTVSAVVTAAVGIGVLLLDRGGPGRATAAGGASYGWVRGLAVPAAAALLLGAGSAVVWTYGRTLLVDRGASDAASTLAWVALGLGGTLTVATARALSDRRPEVAWLVTAVATAAATAALGLAADRLAVAIVACTVFGWGFVAATSALIAWAGRVVPERAGPGTALLFVTLVLGQAVGSSAAGGVVEARGTTAAFLLAAAVTGVAAAAGIRRPGGRSGPRRRDLRRPAPAAAPPRDRDRRRRATAAAPRGGC